MASIATRRLLLDESPTNADWLRRLAKMRLAEEWDEGLHPREPAGSSDGGQFASGGGGTSGALGFNTPLKVALKGVRGEKAARRARIRMAEIGKRWQELAVENNKAQERYWDAHLGKVTEIRKLTDISDTGLTPEEADAELTRLQQIGIEDYNLINSTAQEMQGLVAEQQKLLQADHPLRFARVYWEPNPLSGERAPENWESQAKSGMDRFRNLVEARPDRNALGVAYVPPSELTAGRTYASSYCSLDRVALTAGGARDDTTIVHELGHWLEHTDVAVGAAARAFYAERTAASPVDPLRGYGWGFGPDENTRRDNWMDAYTGKVYSNGATEVVSMGLQHMIEDPSRFAEKDPEHFEFTYRVMKGTV